MSVDVVNTLLINHVKYACDFYCISVYLSCVCYNRLILNFVYVNIVEGRMPIFGSKWASCPASCAHLSEGNQCFNYCVGLGYRNGGECYYNGSPYGNCCCNTD